MLRPEGLLVYFDVPEVGLAVENAQYFVYQQHLPPVPVRKYLEAINYDIVEADHDHVHYLVVPDLKGPLQNQYQQQQVVRTEHVQQQRIIHILNQLGQARAPPLGILILLFLQETLFESSSNNSLIEVLQRLILTLLSLGMLAARVLATGSAPAPKAVLQVARVFLRVGQLVPEVVEVPLANHVVGGAPSLTGLDLHLVLGEFVAVVELESHCKNIGNNKLYALLRPKQPNIAQLALTLLQPQELYALNIVVQRRDHIVPELHEHHHARYREDVEKLVGLLHIRLRNS